MMFIEILLLILLVLLALFIWFVEHHVEIRRTQEKCHGDKEGVCSNYIDKNCNTCPYRIKVRSI